MNDINLLGRLTNTLNLKSPQMAVIIHGLL